MSLAEEIAAQSPRPISTPCTVSIILARLDDADRRDLQAALNNDTVTTAGIFRALRARGHTLADSTIARHRRGDCKCP